MRHKIRTALSYAILVLASCLCILLAARFVMEVLLPGDVPAQPQAPGTEQIDPGMAVDPAGGEPASGTGLTIRFIDVGQADAALVTTESHAMLIDGGNVGDADIIYSIIEREAPNGRLDYVIGTHAHEDHIGGLPAAYRATSVQTTLCPVEDYSTRAFQNFRGAAEAQNAPIRIPSVGEVFDLGDGASFVILAVNTEPDDANNTSIVLMLRYGDVKVLFTGDAEVPVEKRILEEDLVDLGADVLKVGHHGSSTSTSYEFLRAVDPDAAIISCETGNSYGHPHEETMARLRDDGVRVWRTDMQGDVVLRTDGKTFEIETARNQDAQTNPTYGQSTPNTPEDPALPETLVGNAKSRKVHSPDCRYLPSEANRVGFETLAEARAEGYDPCGTCLPGR